MKFIITLYTFGVLLSCSRHQESENDLASDVPLEVSIPENFPPLAYDISRNPPTKNGFELGKKLFYDGKLSSNGFISCGFCHEQRFSFTHHGHQFSHGVEDREGKRNTPSIANMGFMQEFAWDGATAHLDLFPIIPITNEAEMDETVTNVIQKLQADLDYRKAFATAFENGKVNSDNMLKALSQFMVMMMSANSKYDKYIRNEGVTLTDNEAAGLLVFQEKCATCHATDLFTDGNFRNNGLPPNPLLNDTGRALVSGNEADNYTFKVPSLRNIAITAPYMHDGRFGSLQSVLNHYRNGVVDSPTLDPALRTENGLGIDLSDTEINHLISFLNTLTDEEFLTDKRFSEY